MQKINELFLSIDAMRIKSSAFFVTNSPRFFFGKVLSEKNQLYDCKYLVKIYRIIQLIYQIAKVANRSYGVKTTN